MSTGNSSHLVVRHSLPLLEEMLAESPVVVVQGARQVGKSTLVAQLVEQHGGKLFSLDDETIREVALANPVEFVEQNPGGVLALDEVQNLPRLLSTIKVSVDANRRPGRFLLTGSADLLHVAGVSESLAGRAETLHLRGLSQGERSGVHDDFIAWLAQAGSSQPRSFATTDYPTVIAEGGYPEAIRRTIRSRKRWFDNYCRSVTSHDAAVVSGLTDLDRLDVLLRLLAATTSHELVLAHVSRQTAIPERSLPAYLRLLDDLYLTQRLPAWGRNLAKRVVARPKALVADPGLAAHLTGATPEVLSDILQRNRLGDLLESFVTAELAKQQTWSDADFRLFHFRDSQGVEVDLVAELPDGRVIAIEVKASVSLARTDFAGLGFLRDRLGSAFVQGVVLYTGTEEVPWGDRLRGLPVSSLWQHERAGLS